MKIEDNVATMTKRNLLCAAWVGLALSVSAKAQLLPSAITSDPARDRGFPAAMTTIASPCK